MSVNGILLSILIMFIFPFGLGFAFKKESESVASAFFWGTLIEWAGMFPVSLYFIYKDYKFSGLTSCCIGLLFAMLVCSGIYYFVSRKNAAQCEKSYGKIPWTKAEIVYCVFFLCLVAFQLYKTLFFDYADGDDSYYVAMAQIIETSDSLYRVGVYEGGLSQVAYRYAIAPFPVWIAFIARITGLNAAVVAHVAVAGILLLVTYVIYFEISKILFENSREKQFMFLSLFAVFAMFSNVSTSTAETFLLTRARQGKEALGNIVIPATILLFLEIIRQGRVRTRDYLLMFAVSLAAGFCSFLGNLLVPLMMLFLFVVSFIKKYSWADRFKIATAVIPNMLVALLYLKLT